MANDKADRPDTPSEADILNAVRKSGYVLDQEAATVLENLGYHVQTSWPFQDPDLGESRELDVFAHREVPTTGQIRVFMELLCECKSGEDRPFVFLSRRRSVTDTAIAPEQFVFPCRRYGRQLENGMTEVSGFEYLELAKYHYWFAREIKAVQLAKIVRNRDRWEAQHDGIYNALLLPLAKALTHRIEENRKFTSMINLCFPVVVLKSPIYEIDTSIAPLVAKPVPHVSFHRRLDSKTVKGSFIFDFATLDGLADLVVNTITPFVEKVVALAQESPARLLPRSLQAKP
jgi:hypothetical protein